MLLLFGPEPLAELAWSQPYIFAKLPCKVVVILKAYVMGWFRCIPIRMCKKQCSLLNSHAVTIDPLKRYPRVMHPHRFNETAKRYMLQQPVRDVLSDLYEEEPLAAQSMFYYKPPGARGQALHQDNFYLKVEPGNCIAAWTANDPADEENGGLLVVPKTSSYDIVCPDLSDSKESFTTHYVKPPKDQKAIPVVMERGDVLFFNGNLIHGSYRNKTKDRFRRSFICHYANSSATHIATHY